MLPFVGTCAADLPTSDGVINGVSETEIRYDMRRIWGDIKKYVVQTTMITM